MFFLGNLLQKKDKYKQWSCGVYSYLCGSKAALYSLDHIKQTERNKDGLEYN
jgi:hypothetical protein